MGGLNDNPALGLEDVRKAVEGLHEAAAGLVLIYRTGGITNAQHEEFGSYIDQVKSQIAPFFALAEVIRETGKTFNRPIAAISRTMP